MKRTKKILIAICLSLVISLGIAMGFPEFTQTINVEAAAKIKISKKKASIDVGKSIKLKIKGTKSKVKWSSNKKSVAKVNSKGKVTGKKAGKAIITATVENKKYRCTVTVKDPKVTSITLNESEAQLEEGESITLTATVYPSNAINKSVSWLSSNTNVATVKNGVVTGINAGTSIITAMAGDKQSICRVTVKKAIYTEEEIIAAIWLHFLTNRLRDPSSLQVSDIVIWGDGTSPSIEIAYSAKNAYGGTNKKSLLGSLYGFDENKNGTTPYIILPNGKYTFPNRRNPKPAGIHLTEKDKRLDINRVKRITDFTYDFNFHVDEYDMLGWHEKDRLSNEILQ